MDTIIDDSSKALILVVDDNPANIQVVGSHLRSENVEIAIATRGDKAITIARNRKPDLILLDIMMPEMDGFEVCSVLKSDIETKDIPIIFLTAKVGTDDVIRGFELGAVDYVTKPFKASELIARVSTHLSLKKYRDELEKMNKELIQMNKEKNEMLGIAAHDLKNPLFSLSIIGKMMQSDDGISKEEIDEYSTDIINSCNRMLDIITNLLDINALEQGKIQFRFEYFDIEESASYVIDTYQKRANEKNIRLIVNLDCSNPTVFVDRNAATQVLDNLISNAVKYSPFNKNVYVTIKEDKDYVSLAIKDEGPGFTDEDKTKIFGKFARLSAIPTNNENSTGLGLSIVKKYIDSMNAVIDLTSQVGEGACFTVSFPKTEKS